MKLHKRRTDKRRGSVALVVGSTTLEGELEKKGGLRGWQGRHFILKGSYLMYKIKTKDQGFAGGVHVFGAQSSVEKVNKTTMVVKGFDEDDAPDAVDRKVKTMTLRARKKHAADAPTIDEWCAALKAAQTLEQHELAHPSPRHGQGNIRARERNPNGSAAISDFREQFLHVAHDGVIDREDLAELLGSFDHAPAVQIDGGIRDLGLQGVSSFTFEQSFALHQRLADPTGAAPDFLSLAAGDAIAGSSHGHHGHGHGHGTAGSLGVSEDPTAFTEDLTNLSEEGREWGNETLRVHRAHSHSDGIVEQRPSAVLPPGPAFVRAQGATADGAQGVAETLRIAIEGGEFVGFIDVDERTTLADARQLILQCVEALPQSTVYRFILADGRTPVSLEQENGISAMGFLPVLVLRPITEWGDAGRGGSRSLTPRGGLALGGLAETSHRSPGRGADSMQRRIVVHLHAQTREYLQQRDGNSAHPATFTTWFAAGSSFRDLRRDAARSWNIEPHQAALEDADGVSWPDSATLQSVLSQPHHWKSKVVLQLLEYRGVVEARHAKAERFASPRRSDRLGASLTLRDSLTAEGVLLGRSSSRVGATLATTLATTSVLPGEETSGRVEDMWAGLGSIEDCDEQLWRIFTYYCVTGCASASTSLSARGWTKILRDVGVCHAGVHYSEGAREGVAVGDVRRGRGGGITVATPFPRSQADVLYHSEASTRGKMDYAEFIRALDRVGDRVQVHVATVSSSGLSAPQELQQLGLPLLLRDFVLHYAGRWDFALWEARRTLAADARMATLQTLLTHKLRLALFELFRFYCNGGGSPDRPIPSIGSERSRRMPGQNHPLLQRSLSVQSGESVTTPVDQYHRANSTRGSRVRNVSSPPAYSPQRRRWAHGTSENGWIMNSVRRYPSTAAGQPDTESTARMAMDSAMFWRFAQDMGLTGNSGSGSILVSTREVSEVFLAAAAAPRATLSVDAAPASDGGTVEAGRNRSALSFDRFLDAIVLIGIVGVEAQLGRATGAAFTGPGVLPPADVAAANAKRRLEGIEPTVALKSVMLQLGSALRGAKMHSIASRHSSTCTFPTHLLRGTRALHKGLFKLRCTEKVMRRRLAASSSISDSPTSAFGPKRVTQREYSALVHSQYPPVAPISAAKRQAEKMDDPSLDATYALALTAVNAAATLAGASLGVNGMAKDAQTAAALGNTHFSSSEVGAHTLGTLMTGHANTVRGFNERLAITGSGVGAGQAGQQSVGRNASGAFAAAANANDDLDAHYGEEALPTNIAGQPSRQGSVASVGARKASMEGQIASRRGTAEHGRAQPHFSTPEYEADRVAAEQHLQPVQPQLDSLQGAAARHSDGGVTSDDERAGTQMLHHSDANYSDADGGGQGQRATMFERALSLRADDEAAGKASSSDGAGGFGTDGNASASDAAGYATDGSTRRGSGRHSTVRTQSTLSDRETDGEMSGAEAVAGTGRVSASSSRAASPRGPLPTAASPAAAETGPRKDAIDALRRGAIFVKYTRWGKPHSREVWLEKDPGGDDREAVFWCVHDAVAGRVRDKKRRIYVDEIHRIETHDEVAKRRCVCVFAFRRRRRRRRHRLSLHCVAILLTPSFPPSFSRQQQSVPAQAEERKAWRGK